MSGGTRRTYHAAQEDRMGTLWLALSFVAPSSDLLARGAAAECAPEAEEATCPGNDLLCPDGDHCCPPSAPVCCPITQGCCPSGTRYSCWVGDGVRGCFATAEEAQARCPAILGACD